MLISLFLLALVVSFFIQAALLNLATKFLKVEQANFKTALLISLFQWLIAFAAGIILVLIMVALHTPDIAANILIMILSFVILHWLLKKYYKTDLKKNFLIYLVFTIMVIVISLVVSIPVRMFVVQPYYAATDSMTPTFEKDEYMLIKIYDKDYQRGDIIVYKYPNKQEQHFIHRIVGLPGEKIQIMDGKVYIFNNEYLDGHELAEDYLPDDITTNSANQEQIVIDDNTYFVLGDNRGNSLDSRDFGSVSKDLIIGKYWTSPPYQY